MKKNTDQTSEGLNQIIEIMNANGDVGELEEIVEKYKQDEASQSEKDL
ncbi:hypothetical protein [Neobacillus kokaensis]|uniref:Uncharacterized protein n=1 Tax=Neobacillus kokaensis TaxID=2759023 RepID=A0ABQ3MYC7_9BACI|nr:hypothetical protein [Neobacillus kokaensis]GHH97427.1 hypothetical protein AM1BK_09700 [Neobacillus kokaensis]